MRKMTSIAKRGAFFIRIIFALLITSKATPSYNQVPGCKDPTANNYSSSATVNDGSCTYNITPYTPPVKVDPMNAILAETSGLQMAGNFLWSFNDGGGAAAIYRIDTLSNTLLQTVNLGGATNVDWEDIAFDGTNFFVGDFGNNANGARTDLKVYKFPLSAIPDYTTNPTVTIPANQVEIINFIYSDQGTPVATTVNSTRFDCEAMIVDSGRIHLFTKNWVDINTVHYMIDGDAAGSYIAAPIDTLATSYLVTGADKSPGQSLIVLLGYQASGFGNHFMHLLSDYSGGKFFNGNKRRIDLSNASIMGQAEGITFRNPLYGYISNERISSVVVVTQKLRSFDISNLIPAYVLPLSLKEFSVNSINGGDKIAWSFDDVAHHLQLEYSSNGIDFSILKIYDNSRKDIFYNRMLDPVNYYRISWRENNGPRQYSNIIRIKNDMIVGITNFLLKKNGILSFFLNGSSPADYAFKLLSSDGRVLAQIKTQSYSPGRNKIYISGKSILNSFVYLTANSNSSEKTIFLRVEK